ncbi:Tetratricopeptide repeat protein 25, partial [Coelomomyces lativittatus]
MEEEQKQIFEEHISTGLICLQNKEFITAISHFTKALNIKSDKGVILERARCYFETGDLEIAAQQVEEFLSEDLNNYKAILLKADILFANKLYEAALALYSKGYSIRKDVVEFSIGIRKVKMALNTTDDDLDKGIQDVAMLIESVENLIPLELENPPSAVTSHPLTIEIPPLKKISSNSTQTKNSPRFPTDDKNSPRSSVSSERDVLKISSTRAKRNYVLKDIDSSPMYLPTTSQSPMKSFTPPDSPSR